MPSKNRLLNSQRRATAALAATLLFLAFNVSASPLDQEPPARMVPICFAHLDKAIAELQNGGSPPDDMSEEALYRGREVFRNWINKHPANPAEAAPAPRDPAELADDMGFCRRIGAVMFQLKPGERAATIRNADAARAADAAKRGKAKPAQ